MKKRGVKTSKDFENSLVFHKDLAEMLREQNDLLHDAVDSLKRKNSQLKEMGMDAIAALSVTRGQWIHSIHKEQCLAVLKKWENLP